LVASPGLLLAAGLLTVMVTASPAGEAAPEPPDARFNRAERLFAAGDIEKAYELYESVGKADPGRWEARTSARMAEIKKLLSSREEAKARAKRLNEAEAAANPPGELAPWLRYEAARGLYDARLFAESRAEAEGLLDKYPESRRRAAGLLLLGRSLDRLGRADDAAKAYRQILAVKGVTRSERAEAWKELDALLSRGGRDAEYRDLLEEQVRRGAEEPGAEEAAERFFSLALAGPKEAARASKLAVHLVEAWPAGSVRAEWALLAAKVAEFVERDYDRADRLYRLVLERYPHVAFDAGMLAAGQPRYDAGREVILAAIARVADKKAGKLKELEAPKPEERGKSPEKALAAVLAALRAGDLEAAKSAAGGALLAEIAGGRCDFARYGLSDFRPLGAARTEGDSAELDYEVSGELGVTRVLKKKAKAGREEGAWKILDLGF
jgi:tetratricopeptide (TPR) repeat protein